MQTSDGVAPRVGADGAGGLFGQRAARVAESDLLAREQNDFGELFHGGGIGLHQMQRQALGGTRPDAGQFGERGDELVMESGNGWMRMTND